MTAAREFAKLAEQLTVDTIEEQSIDPGTLMLHSDRGTLDAAFAANRNCFKRVPASPPVLATAAWINPSEADPSIFATAGCSVDL